MSATLSTYDHGDAAGLIDFSGTPPIPFSRLVRVELRKMFDTRAGLWLGIVTGVLIVLAMVIPLVVIALNDDVSISATIFITQIMTVPLSLLVPVFAITAVTSEWGQRTGLVTFALEARRSRVILAKLVVVVILAVATIALAVALGALGTALGGLISGEPPAWNLSLGVLAWVLGQQLAFFVMAFAFGLLLLSTAGAVSIYYVVALLLPLMVWGPLYGIFSWGRDVVPWFDLGFAAMPFTSGLTTSGIDYLRVLATVTVWVLVPLALGLRRVLRAEVK
jgi:ABC-type transport system involved in multi-copper enzyme maturation permease subunit